MRRRELLGVGTATALGILATRARAAETAVDHSKMDHSKMDHSKMNHAGRAAPALAKAATECVAAGEACLQHGLEMLASGDRTMADCLRSVRQTMAACEALGQLAVQGSSYLPRFAAVVRDMCRECEKACEPHAATHAVCARCRDACIACARECDAVSA